MGLAFLMHPGILAALGSALLFGAATPLAKGLVDSNNPWMLAGLLYLGSGIGLSIYRRLISAPSVTLPRAETLWFAGAVLSGGVVGPVPLMMGLKGSTASATALLLNMEGVFTALLAWFAFKENFDRRIAVGMLAIVAGAVILSWPGDAKIEALWPSLAILGACLAWAIDNNLTRKVSLTDASWIAAVKGLIAGSINLIIALSLGAQFPALRYTLAALLVGVFAYGISLVLFVVGLRHLGTARTGAYFSVAPLFGGLLAIVMGEPVTLPLTLAAGLMAWGVWLHLTENHEHLHTHEALSHQHEHGHDAHHRHEHVAPTDSSERHAHWHTHAPTTHAHPHYPDAHHTHRH
jgi:drug/metabolite transporter (DMT)-like permease